MTSPEYPQIEVTRTVKLPLKSRRKTKTNQFLFAAMLVIALLSVYAFMVAGLVVALLYLITGTAAVWWTER